MTFANKWLLAGYSFNFPLSLLATQLAFTVVLAWLLRVVRSLCCLILVPLRHARAYRLVS